jgi:hypothetical protein
MSSSLASAIFATFSHRTKNTTTRLERTYRCRTTRRFGVMCAEQGACVSRRSWAGYTINMFEFEFPTGTGLGLPSLAPRQPIKLTQPARTNRMHLAWEGRRHEASRFGKRYLDLLKSAFGRFRVGLYRAVGLDHDAGWRHCDEGNGLRHVLHDHIVDLRGEDGAVGLAQFDGRVGWQAT